MLGLGAERLFPYADLARGEILRPPSIGPESFVTAEAPTGSKITAGIVSIGELFTNAGLSQRYKGLLLPDKLSVFLEAQGVEERYRLPGGTVLENRDGIGRELIEMGIYLASRARQEMGNPRIDRVYFTGSIPPNDFPPHHPQNWGREIARRSGVQDAELRFVYAACAGAGFSFVHALMDPEARDKTILVVSLEAIQSAVRQEARLEDLASQAIFTDGGGILGFKTSDFRVLWAEAVVVPDRTEVSPGVYGVIRSPIPAPMPEPDGTMPDWVKARGVTPEVFAYSKEVIALQLPESGSPYLEMDGNQTAKHFVLHGAPGIRRAREVYPFRRLVCHNPSLMVFRHLGFKSGCVVVHNGKESSRHLKGEELNNAPRLEWVSRAGNGSSRETITSFKALLEEGIAAGEVFGLTSFGAGSVFVSGVVEVAA